MSPRKPQKPASEREKADNRDFLALVGSLGLTLGDLVERTGFTRPRLRNYFTSKTRPPKKALRQILEKLGLPESALEAARQLALQTAGALPLTPAPRPEVPKFYDVLERDSARLPLDDAALAEWIHHHRMEAYRAAVAIKLGEAEQVRRRKSGESEGPGARFGRDVPPFPRGGLKPPRP